MTDNGTRWKLINFLSRIFICTQNFIVSYVTLKKFFLTNNFI